MKIHYIALKESKLLLDISKLRGDFLKSQEFAHKLYLQKKLEEKETSIEKIKNDVLSNSQEWSETQKDWINKTLERVGSDLRGDIHHKIKEECQENWLARLENFYCEKILEAYNSPTLKNEWERSADNILTIVLLPEFAFTEFEISKDIKTYFEDTNKDAFYKSVVEKFLKGSLSCNAPGSGKKLMSLLQLTRKKDTPKRKLMIFGGTIIEKEKENDQTKPSTFYNIAPVFFEGKLYGIWEKQMISNIDGKMTIKHRHLELFPQNSQLFDGTSEKYVASSLSKQILKENKIVGIKPVFEATIFQQKISFAISVCLDYTEPEIIGGEHVDIQVLISDGMNPFIKTKNIVASNLLLFCDYKGGAALYNKKEILFIKEYEEKKEKYKDLKSKNDACYIYSRSEILNKDDEVYIVQLENYD